MIVRQTYIIQKDKLQPSNVWQLMYQTFNGKFFIDNGTYLEQIEFDTAMELLGETDQKDLYLSTQNIPHVLKDTEITKKDRDH